MKPEKTLRFRALELLSRGEYSRLQLRQKLSKHCEDAQEIEGLLNTLEQTGWQSDQRFAETLIHSKSRRLGNRRLQQELQQKGVDAELFQDALPPKSAQIETALEVVSKKFKVYDQEATMRLKYMRFLAYRGFDMDVIHAALHLWQEADEHSD